MRKNIVEVDRAFFCDSPFQVFTGIHMLLHDSIESDMYILDSFRDAQRLASKLQELSVFRRTILINSEHLYRKEKSVKKRSIKSSLGTFATYFRVNSITSNYLEKNVRYKTMYFTCNQLSFRLARFYFIKKGYNTEYVMFDEGAGSYDGHFERVKKSDRIVRTLLFGKESDNKDLKLHLYQPKLYFDYQNSKDRIIGIPKVDDIDINYKEIYDEVFLTPRHGLKKKCIFFDSLREEVCFSNYALEKLDVWFKLTEEVIGADNLCVKSHPRAYGRYPHQCEEYKANSPMEVNYMTMDLDNMCFVALLSTAVISPKMIYDKEPYVVLLCNVDKAVYNPRTELLDFYKSVKDSYRDPSRFMIPNNESELKQCLETVANMVRC